MFVFLVLKFTKITANHQIIKHLFYESLYRTHVNLVNRWGKDSRVGAVLINGGGGVEGIEISDMKAYPNPFVDGVNIAFAKEGEYKVEVSSINGAVIGSKNITALANDVVYIDVNGTSGIYFVKVIQGNKCIKTLKVIKK